MQEFIKDKCYSHTNEYNLYEQRIDQILKLGFEVSTQDNDMQFIAITEPTTTVYTTNVYDIKAKVKNW